MLLQRFIGKARVNLRKKRVLLLLAIFFLLFFFVYGFHNKLFNVANSVVDNISEKTGVNLGKTFYDFESAINIFRPKKDLWTGELPFFQLKMSQNDIIHFNELSQRSVQRGYLDKNENTWRDIKLKYKDKTYDAKVKLHGDLSNHWVNEVKSYNIEIQDNESINNLKKFSLIIFEDRDVSARIAKILSNEFGLFFNVRDDFVVLKINGVPQGLYYMVEALDTTFFEYNGCSSCELIRSGESKFKDHPREKESDNPNLDSWEPYGLVTLRSQHVTPFDYDLSNIDLKKSDLDLKKTINAVNGLYRAVKDEDTSRLLNYFDTDYLTSFEAESMILGFGQIMGDNLKLVYRATNSKFYPIGFEGGLYPLRVEKGGLERSLNIYKGVYNEEEIKLFSLLNRNDQIRQLKYKKAYNYILDNEVSLLKKIDTLVDQYLPYANANRYNTKGTKVIEDKIKSYKPLLERNMDIIKAALEYAKSYINVIEKDNKVILEVMPDSISPLRFDSLKINTLPESEYSGTILLEYKYENGFATKSINIKEKTSSLDLTDLVRDFYFSTGLDEDLGTKKRVYTIELVFQNTDKILIDSVQIKMKNDVTGKPLNDDEVYLQIADANDYYPDLVSSSVSDFIKRYKEFNWAYEGSKLKLLKGAYVLDKDLIVPKGLIWDIEPGVQILIDEGKSIVSYSPVNVKGTENEPVIIKALDPAKPFGVFGVVGEKGYKTTINWLKLSGGNEKFINGLYLSGGLSLYHTDVDMGNTIISEGHSDDGINIKYGNALIDNCLFTNNFADHIDFDFVQGIVKNSRFEENDPNADDNGDGLDLSGSKIIAKNNVFEGFKDKGVSIGEDTFVVLYNNQMINNRLGAAVKDASQAFFIKNLFKNNEAAISAYQKKEIYPGGGYVYLYNNNFETNAEDCKLDKKSYKQDLELDKDIYDLLILGLTNEDLELVFATLNPFVKK